MKFFNFYKNKSLQEKTHFDDISGYEEEKWILEEALLL